MKAKLEHLRTFLLVCTEGSLAAASRAMDVSAAAVSKQIAALERSVGMGLLERTTRRLVLTAAGEVYRRHAIDLLRTLDERETACFSVLRGEPAGTLRVVAARMLGQHFLVPHLHTFLERHPRIELELELAERFPDLEQDSVELVFAMSMPGTAGLKRRSIGKAAYWLCASPAYLQRHGEPLSPDDLMSHRLIAHTMRRPRHVLALKGSRDVAMPVALALNDTHAMLEAARAGIGLVSLHHYMVAQDVAEGRLVRLLRAWESPATSLDLFYRHAGMMQPALRAFIDFAVAHCKVAPLPQP